MKTLTNIGMVDIGTIDVEDIDTVCVAKALSRLIRFCGNFDGPISVAQHCIIVSQVVQSQGGSAMEQLAGLHHDDCEAFLGDLPSPIKRKLPGYQELESRVLDVIDEKYRISTRAQIVKSADTEVGVAEMMFHCEMSQHLPRVMSNLPGGEVMISAQALMPWPYEEVLAKFIDRHDALVRDAATEESVVSSLTHTEPKGELN